MPMEATKSGKKTLLKPFDVEEYRTCAHAMVDFVADYYKEIERYPVRSQVKPGYLKKLLPTAAPEDPESLDDIISDVRSKIVPGLTHWQSPGFFAYYPCNTSTASMMGDLLCSGLNVNAFTWISSPAATELETVVLDWLGKLLQLPDTFLSSGLGGGVIQSTASECVLVGLLAAHTSAVNKLLEKGYSEPNALSKLVAYSSDQTHSCMLKGCQIAGIHAANIRILVADKSTNYALSPELLSRTVAEDVASGKVPFFLCGTVGTTSSSAVDAVKDLGIIAEENGMWFHVDAAYGGNACICPEFRHYLDGIEKADSFTINPHKWLLTGFDCSALWVKDRRALIAALSTSPPFLKNMAGNQTDVIDYKDWQIPLGRRFRALKLWMVLRMYGTSGLRTFIRQHISIAQKLEELVLANAHFEILAPCTFALVCFRLKPPVGEHDNGNSINVALLEAVNNSGLCFLTHTLLGATFTLRMAVGGTLTELKHVIAAWDLIQHEAKRLLSSNTSTLTMKKLPQ